MTLINCLQLVLASIIITHCGCGCGCAGISCEDARHWILIAWQWCNDHLN